MLFFVAPSFGFVRPNFENDRFRLGVASFTGASVGADTGPDSPPDELDVFEEELRL